VVWPGSTIRVEGSMAYYNYSLLIGLIPSKRRRLPTEGIILAPPAVACPHPVYDHQLGLDRWTAHDIRRTVLTKMAELGVAPIVLGHVANHRTTTKAGVTLGIYVQHAYEREKREALELWANRLQKIIR
jgi:hypothetical protein